ncbi:efflux RND transporter permease subunit [Alkalicaulis satelles]|uniref:Efflux RND transporter permease subunit n=1 Tax=Alkalicaulis satelles TaxID=2609175 RepID=A0A5M6ZDY6_9PROT|nr:efflux RND transporter permease subunit [Alkalicaulis satelles]
MSVARLSIEKPVLTWMVILACLLGGIYGINTVAQLEDPAFTIKQAMVYTAYPGASAEEVEREVTERLETAIQQMPQLDAVRSKSQPGMSEIRVEIRDRYASGDLPQIWDELRKRLSDAAPSLPPGARTPVVLDDFGDVYGIFYAVIAPGYSDAEIRDIAELLRRELLVTPGVSKISTDGVPEERIYIEIPQENLARLGLPVNQVLETLSSENAVVDAGMVSAGDARARIDMPGAIGGVDAISNLLISPRDSGQTLRLSDLGQVTRGPVERAEVYVYHNGQAAFTLGVSGLPTANIVDVGRAVEARLAVLADDLPLGVEIVPIYKQHRVVASSINNFLISLALSVGIVIGVLCLTMGWRAGISVGSVLLLTVLGTLFFMSVFGITMQRISLGALIIAMGMLVDNALVVTENMQVAVQRGVKRLKAAEDAAANTQWPLLGATVIGIMAFSGIGLSPDSTGEFLFSLFAVIAISLMLSWVLALTVAPMIAYHLFKSERGADADPYRGRMYKSYRAALIGALRRRWITVAAMVTVTIASIWGFGFVKSAFFPNSNTPMFFVSITQSQGTDILASRDLARDMARWASQQPGVTQADAFAGRGATRFMLTYNTEQPNAAFAQLIVQTARTRDIPDVEARILDHLAQTYPHVEARSDRIVFGPPSGAQLEARFKGPDAQVLRALGEDAVTHLREEAGVRDLRIDWRNRALTLTPQIIEARARTVGVTRADIGEALRLATDGERVGVYREGIDLIPIIARAPAAERANPDNLSDRLIWSPAQNAYVPMSQVVSGFTLQAEDTLIIRRDKVRTLTVQANPMPGETAAQAFTRFSAVVNAMDMPRGYRVEWGGEYEANREANESLGGVLPISFIVMLTVSFLLFMTVRQPLIVWLIVPMSICGVTAGLLATGIAFSFTALLGLLSLSGMLIKNAIVLIDEIDRRRREGETAWGAVVDGSVSRLRPVLLAAGTTILGMTPLLGDAFFQGMAMTIISGLAFASIITLIAVPVIYALFFTIKEPDSGLQAPVQNDPTPAQ